MAAEENASFTTRALLLATRLGARLFNRREGIMDSASDEDHSGLEDDDDEEAMETSFSHRHRAPSESSESVPVRKEKNSNPPLQNVLAQLTNMATSPSPQYLKFARAKKGKPVNTVAMLAGRESNVSGHGRFSNADACHMAARYLPKDGPEVLHREASRVYISQFSNDGSLFIAGFQDRRIVIYDVDKGWSIRKDVIARNLRWTITDTALSPDQRFLVYASITPVVNLVNVGNESGGIESLANVTDIHEGLQFASEDSEGAFGIWSLKFSHDGDELVAGSDDNSIYVYDLNANRTTFRVIAHKDEVNAVAFADDSSHLIFSGSDDYVCKVWDRRCFSSRNKCAGKLNGHLGGITYIDSRGDGRHFISNSKDQTIKLWDIRTMSCGTRPKKYQVPTFRWDYRYMKFPARDRSIRHPGDESLMTYEGHEVLRTLIRCYFSPACSTGQKFIYTGSHDGCIYIYDLMTGDTVEKLDFHRITVRDCSWHPWQPMLVSSCWNGTIAKWEHLHGEKLQGPAYERPPARFRVDYYYDSD